MFLGIDIGTSGVKAVIVDGDAVVAQAQAPLSVDRPGPLMSEQDPNAWWAATEAAVLALDPAPRRGVRGVGLSGQMHGATLIGADDRPLRPAILWNDGRSFAECDELVERCPELTATTGNLAMPGFTAPKLLWVAKHEPELFARVAKVLLPKDYVRLCMTGDHASDMSDSSGTLWLNVAERAWSPEVLAACNLGVGQMPALVEGSQATGVLRADIATAWDMARVPVAGGGGDNAAGAVGVGVIAPGEGLLSLGTSGVTFLADDRYRPNPAGGVHTFCHALPNRWHQMSVMLSAASAVDWMAGAAGFASTADLHAACAARDRPCERELFLPYISGERTPHNDPRARGVLFGIDAGTDRVTMGQAALEGVAFGLADGIDALADTGAAIETLTVIGGGALSPYWGRLLSAVLDRRLVYRIGGEVGPAFGAARLARLAVDGEAPEAVCIAPPILAVIDPDPALRDHYAARRPAFRRLYRALAPEFAEA